MSGGPQQRRGTPGKALRRRRRLCTAYCEISCWDLTEQRRCDPEVIDSVECQIPTQNEAGRMQRFLLQCAAVGLVALLAASPASAEKKGGVLRIYMHDSPASMSIHEEALNSAQNPMMAVFNNLDASKNGVFCAA
jgi:hypothetical protein